MSEPRKHEITVTNVASSAAGGAASAVALSYFGATGSLIGAAVGPVVFLIAKELVKRPSEHAASRLPRPQVRSATPSDEPVPVHGVDAPAGRRRLRRPHVVALGATAVLATLLVIAAFTLPEVLAGRSLVSDRDRTFFTRTPAAATHERQPATTRPQGGRPVPAGGHTAPTTTAPVGPEPTATTPQVPKPAPVTTAPAAPTPAPAPAPAPQAQPAPPAATTPAAPVPPASTTP